jgi:hypothetical protein
MSNPFATQRFENTFLDNAEDSWLQYTVSSNYDRPACPVLPGIFIDPALFIYKRINL